MLYLCLCVSVCVCVGLGTADIVGERVKDREEKAGDSLVEITPDDAMVAKIATDTKGYPNNSDGATERVGVTGEAGEGSKKEITTPEDKAEKNESVTPIIDKKLNETGSHICSNSRICECCVSLCVCVCRSGDSG